MEQREAFKVAWAKELPSHELPNLDFLGDESLAREKFQSSVAVIKECLNTINLEVFIVNFLRSRLSGVERAADFNLALTIDDVVNKLDLIFPRRHKSDGSCYTHIMKSHPGRNKRMNIRDFQFSRGERQGEQVASEISNGNTLNNEVDDLKPDKNSASFEDTKNTEKLSAVQSGAEDEKNASEVSNTASDDVKISSNESENGAGDAKSTMTTESNSPVPTSPEAANSPETVTIFTPIEEKSMDFDTYLPRDSKTKLSPLPSLKAGVTSVSDSNEGASPPPATGQSEACAVRGNDRIEEDELPSSGNELDENISLPEERELLSSDSGSCSPVRVPYTPGNGESTPTSDEILNIMPFSSRANFYYVDPSLENTQVDAAEHIYEDITKISVPAEDEGSEIRRVSSLQASDTNLRKTVSAVALRKKKDSLDDVFTKNEIPEDGPTKQGHQSPDNLPIPNTIHKRSSSDACASYNIRTNISNKQKQARRDRVAFRLVDRQDMTDADGSSQDIRSPLEQAVDDAHKLHMRKWVVASLVDSERGYLEALEKLTIPMKAIKASMTTSSPICTVFDFHKIYDKVEELYKIHRQFLADLEQRVSNWNLNQIIGDLFTVLMDQFKVYHEYIRNNKMAMETITKCKISEQFQNIFTQGIVLVSTQEMLAYEKLFRKPLERIARYILVMDDLIKYTPEEHPDYEMLQTFMKRAQTFLESNFSDKHNISSMSRLTRKKKNRKLSKDAFVVELVDGQRKFRHLFLFTDLFVSAKLKATHRSGQFAIKWYCSMQDIIFYPTQNSESAQTVPVTSNFEIDNLKAKIAAIKADIRQEQGMSEGYASAELEKRGKRTLSTTSMTSVTSRAGLNSTKTMERLKRKLLEQEAALWLAMPSLPLTIYRKSGKTHRFLFSSDVARGDWKREIAAQQKKATGTQLKIESPLSPLEMQGLAETCLEMRTVRSLGSVNLKDDDNVFTGVLYVVVNSGKGFIKPIDCYVVLEVDYYGHYVRKAKSKVCKATQDPLWEQGFHIEVEGTQFIKVLCYSKGRMMGDELCGLGTIKLEKNELLDCHYHDYTVILDKQGCILMSIQYSTTLEGIHHRRSVSSSGVFGVSLDTVIEREKSEIPLVVIACCNEVERRGLQEVGIYRVSGVSSDVKRLKEKFDENSQEAVVYISEADIHAVAGTMKQYFRELPDPLFTAKLYPMFLQALEITNEDKKEKHLLELLEQLSPARKATALFLIEHLRRVSQCDDENKMTLGNLATIFGPNLLRPAPTEKPANAQNTTASVAMEMASGTFNVMSQTSIFYWFLRCKNSKVKLATTPEITRRLFPAQKDVVIARLSSQSEDKLI